MAVTRKAAPSAKTTATAAPITVAFTAASIAFHVAEKPTVDAAACNSAAVSSFVTPTRAPLVTSAVICAAFSPAIATLYASIIPTPN